jgi:hypothetical protein
MYLELRILAPEGKPVSRLVSKVVDITLSEMKYNVRPKTTEMPLWGCRYFRFLDYKQTNSSVVLSPG